MLRDIISECRQSLTDGGIEDPSFETACIVEAVTGYDRTHQILHSEESISAECEEKLRAMVCRRLKHYPLQYILGSWSFMGFPLRVGEGVLIPRDDTEVCVSLCLDFLKDKPNARALDLCAGSGAIAIALNKLADANVTAVELSERAYKFLLENIKSNHAQIKAVRGDIFVCHQDFPDRTYDLIVSNPPYIPTGELTGLQPEVRHEPDTALDGGQDGCDFYRAIISEWSRKLKSGGALVFELGEHQSGIVSALLKAHGFENIRTADDFGGIHRAIIGTML